MLVVLFKLAGHGFENPIDGHHDIVLVVSPFAHGFGGHQLFTGRNRDHEFHGPGVVGPVAVATLLEADAASDNAGMELLELIGSLLNVLIEGFGGFKTVVVNFDRFLQRGHLVSWDSHYSTPKSLGVE